VAKHELFSLEFLGQKTVKSGQKALKNCKKLVKSEQKVSKSCKKRSFFAVFLRFHNILNGFLA
jgi:hypothetical protein